MINIEKIKIYKRFRGDIDSFIRTQNKKLEAVINEDDFRSIEELVQDYTIIKNNLASSEYKEKFNKKILMLCEAADLPTILVEFDKISRERW